MRGVWLSLVVIACGKGASQDVVATGSGTPIGSAAIGSGSASGSAAPVSPPVTVAVIADDHVKVLELAPKGIAVKRDVKLPTAAVELRWLDREHIVAVDIAGKAYLVTGDTAAAYKLPPAKAWKVKAGAGEHSATYPMKLALTRTAAGIELASCATYYQGDDDPCVTWSVVSLDTSLEVGPVTNQPDAPTDDATEPEIAAAAKPTIEWQDNADGVHENVTLKLGTAKRDWKSEQPCPIIDANVKWLSADPQIISFTTTSDCGEGGPNDEEHLLRLPALTDFGPDKATLVLGPGLWAHEAERGWTLLSGDHEVGTLASAPVIQPATDPTGHTAVAPTPANKDPNHLALRRGEKLRSPATEMEWKLPAMHAVVVDVVYKQRKNKPPISKLVVWTTGKRFDIVRTSRACDAFAELRAANDMLVFRCGSRPVGDEPEGMIEDWLVRWSKDKHAPLRNKHWSGDPAADEPAWARAK